MRVFQSCTCAWLSNHGTSAKVLRGSDLNVLSRPGPRRFSASDFVLDPSASALRHGFAMAAEGAKSLEAKGKQAYVTGSSNDRAVLHLREIVIMAAARFRCIGVGLVISSTDSGRLLSARAIVNSQRGRSLSNEQDAWMPLVDRRLSGRHPHAHARSARRPGRATAGFPAPDRPRAEDEGRGPAASPAGRRRRR